MLNALYIFQFNGKCSYFIITIVILLGYFQIKIKHQTILALLKKINNDKLIINST